MITLKKWKRYKWLGAYNKGIRECTKSIESDPENAVIYRYRADLYRDQDKIDLAIKDYDKAIEIDPDYASAYTARGVAYGLAANYTRAIADFNRSIQLKSDKNGKASAYNHLGFTYSCIGEYDKAITCLNTAIKLASKQAAAFCNIGFAYSAVDEYNLAIQHLNTAIALDCEYSRAYRNRGYVYACIKKFSMAFADHAKDIFYCNKRKGRNLKNPFLKRNVAFAYNAKGLTHALKGNRNYALRDYKKAINLTKHPSIYLNIGDLHQKNGNDDEAIKNYDNSILYSPNHKTDFTDRNFFHNAGNTIINARKLLNDKINNLTKNTAEYFYYKGVRAVFRNDTTSAEAWFNWAKDATSKGTTLDLKQKIDLHLKNIKDRI